MCMLGAHRDLRRVLDSLDLKLQMAKGAGNGDRSFRRATGALYSNTDISSAPILFTLIVSHVTTMDLDSSSSTNLPGLP